MMRRDIVSASAAVLTMALISGLALSAVLRPTRVSVSPVALAQGTSDGSEWHPAGDLLLDRCDHTLTLLGNSRVLLAGGWGNTGGFEQLFDPSTGQWRRTGSLTADRTRHTATLLPSGYALVAGGDGDGSAELYDPDAGVWRHTGPLQIERRNHAATLLADGRVLVAGGGSEPGVTDTAEQYVPATESWTVTGSMSHSRSLHTATRLGDGRVLVAGGHNGVSALGSAEIYDPSAGTWQRAGDLSAARFAHTATLLRDGRVLVAGGDGSRPWGGSRYDPTVLTSAELFDPAAAGWTTVASLGHARVFHTGTRLDSGLVLVSGGFTRLGPTGELTLTATAELYDPMNGE